MTTAWLLFPVVLLVLSLGCGLLLERAAGLQISAPLLLPAGAAVIVVAGSLATLTDATAELATPAIVALALAGLATAWPWSRARFDVWAAVAGLLVFVVFACPVVLSGHATLTGFIRLDDTASWLAITDSAIHHGRSVPSLAPSTYEATLQFYLGSDYPLGALVPLGAGGKLVGQDIAWLFQPYLAFFAGLLSLTLYELSGALVRSRPARCLVAVVAAQPAILFGYTLWGGFKEIATAWLVALLAALAIPIVGDRRPRALIPAAVVTAAALDALSVGGAIWVLPLLAVVLVAVWRSLGRVVALGLGARFAAVVAVLSIPALISVSFLTAPASSTVTNQSRLANLIHPLSGLQLFGIWPVGDFRRRPSDMTSTRILIVVLVGLGIFALVRAWQRRSWPLLLYVGAVLVSAMIVIGLGSPWVDAKGLAIASPAVVMAGMLGGALLLERGERVAGVIACAAVIGGVVWSNVVEYSGTTVAPRDRFGELASIGHKFSGEGPTLMTDYEPFGARYFLRHMDPEGASELRRRQVQLRNGQILAPGETADIDQFDTRAVFVYRTLVLRRSPVASRPPSAYRLIRRGRFYDVWQRPVGAAALPRHLPLGGTGDAGGRFDCSALPQLIRGTGARLVAAVPAPPPTFVSIGTLSLPRGWATSGNVVTAKGGGRATSIANVPATARYDLWLAGSIAGGASVDIDGQRVGSIRQELSHGYPYTLIGSVPLTPGAHRVTFDYSGGDAHPGSHNDRTQFGPLALSSPGDDRLRTVSATDARSLCGQRLDWVEALPR